MKERIRQFLTERGLDALLITRTDSFLGEHYPPESGQFRQATGFDGSAGIAVISATHAVLFVDSRYTEQARLQSDFTVYEVPTQTTPSDWIQKNIPGAVIGYNPWQRPVAWVAYMLKKGITLQEISPEDWGILFPPAENTLAPAFDYEKQYCGTDSAEKIKQVARHIREKGLDAFIFTTPDSVSYLLNRRSLTVPEYPVVFERLIVRSDGTVCPLGTNLTDMAGTRIGMDLNETPQGLLTQVQTVAQVISEPDVAAQMKAVKNKTEQENIRQACLFESAVLCRFLATIERQKETLDEMACDTLLKQFRSENPLYRGDSFDTIAAVGEHAARAHYRADTMSNTPLTAAPMLLVDTGGNYLNGTTDMTRTICIGKPTTLMKKRYTQVLQGHIALATTRLKSGDMPGILDERARAPLQADGADYGHATGHGIGLFLAVHEAPPVIYKTAQTPLTAGMVFSNEPAYYSPRAGFGIRLENMLMTVPGTEDTLILENLLWVPFDGRLIQFNRLTDSEKAWLTAYHMGIREHIWPMLSQADRDTLKPLLDFFI